MHEKSEHIRVVVRCRPLNEHEIAQKSSCAVNINPENQREVQVYSSDRGGISYRCDGCFGSDIDQAFFFDQIGAKDMIDDALNGFSATIFAYGQTGAGKTYTMLGEEKIVTKSGYAMEFVGTEQSSDGLVPRTIRHLFRCINDRTVSAAASGVELRFTVRATALEIYNDQVQDLLRPAGSNLHVRSTAEGLFFVAGLTVAVCLSACELLAIASAAARNRKMGSHRLNGRSTRAHAILSLYVDVETVRGGCHQGEKRFGKITLVDLAGSERLKETGSEGVTLKEAGFINRSLHTLGAVIGALTDARVRANRMEGADNNLGLLPPFRDSKLTKLLMDSLGGNCKTLMIACISPASECASETLRSLSFAMRVKRIRNKPALLLSPQEQLIQRLRSEIEALKQENSLLRFTAASTSIPSQLGVAAKLGVFDQTQKAPELDLTSGFPMHNLAIDSNELEKKLVATPLSSGAHVLTLSWSENGQNDFDAELLVQQEQHLRALKQKIRRKDPLDKTIKSENGMGIYSSTISSECSRIGFIQEDCLDVDGKFHIPSSLRPSAEASRKGAPSKSVIISLPVLSNPDTLASNKRHAGDNLSNGAIQATTDIQLPVRDSIECPSLLPGVIQCVKKHHDESSAKSSSGSISGADGAFNQSIEHKHGISASSSSSVNDWVRMQRASQAEARIKSQSSIPARPLPDTPSTAGGLIAALAAAVEDEEERSARRRQRDAELGLLSGHSLGAEIPASGSSLDEGVTLVMNTDGHSWNDNLVKEAERHNQPTGRESKPRQALSGEELLRRMLMERQRHVLGAESGRFPFLLGASASGRSDFPEFLIGSPPVGSISKIKSLKNNQRRQKSGLSGRPYVAKVGEDSGLSLKSLPSTSTDISGGASMRSLDAIRSEAKSILFVHQRRNQSGFSF